MEEAFDDIVLSSKSNSTPPSKGEELSKPVILRKASQAQRGSHQPSQASNSEKNTTPSLEKALSIETGSVKVLDLSED